MHTLSFLCLLAASSFAGVHSALIKVQVGKNSTGQLDVSGQRGCLDRTHLVIRKTVFNPNQVTAQVGDTIQFEFMAKNHTATQSSFAEVSTCPAKHPARHLSICFVTFLATITSTLFHVMAGSNIFP